MKYDWPLINEFVFGAIAIAATCLVSGWMMIYYFLKKRYFSQKIYLPLGLFFVFVAITKGLEVLSVWHNYARLVSLSNLLSGLCAIAFFVLLPSTILQRQVVEAAYDLHHEKEDMEKKINVFREIVKVFFK